MNKNMEIIQAMSLKTFYLVVVFLYQPNEWKICNQPSNWIMNPEGIEGWKFQKKTKKYIEVAITTYSGKLT